MNEKLDKSLNTALGWLIDHVNRWWMRVIVIVIAAWAVASGPIFAGLGLGMMLFLGVLIGVRYTVDTYTKEKEKTND